MSVSIYRRLALAVVGSLTIGALEMTPARAQPTVPARPAYCAHIPPASATLSGATTFVYRSLGDRQLRVHVFQPEAGGEKHPAILLFFGGGFRVGDASAMTDLAK